ncbi:inositol monophosphatase family protein [Calycomorphotria hydatis]|uniref:Inositol-1-monophosphatase n=1 Tax=Calycomorphotria hydatis TaxID=2528027 RepID=A0A517TAI2_9PLAN|nr:inositol monophosphatase family protein [Calycomorphotria hydatis]QDT65376.1 Inositol-1-monophosphatase [Calycomorphotria hydatis]
MNTETAMSVDWQAVLDVGVTAARQAGDILLDWSDRFTVREKGRADLVTEADFASQEAIVKIIAEAFPEHGLLGEEGLEQPAKPGTPDICWVIDPLDGTSNYVHGFPYYAVSIGITQDGETLAGVVYDPQAKEMFTAAPGVGAFRNEKPIQVSNCETLEQALLVASLPRNTDPKDPAVRRFLTALPEAESVQRTGSAALNLCNVACGRLDGFWSSSLKPWDMAAGAALVKEAGGVISTIAGEEFDVSRPDLLVTNGSSLHSELVDLLDLSSPRNSRS